MERKYELDGASITLYFAPECDGKIGFAFEQTRPPAAKHIGIEQIAIGVGAIALLAASLAVLLPYLNG